MKIILAILMLMLVIPICNAVTLTETTKVNTSLDAGGSKTFLMIFTPTEAEKDMQFSNVQYGCDFITTDKKIIPLNEPQTVKATINVPKNTITGVYNCDLEFQTPAIQGMVSYNIGVPVKVYVNGINAISTPKVIDTPIENIVIQTAIPQSEEIKHDNVQNGFPVSSILMTAGIVTIGAIIGIYYVKRKGY